MSMISVQDLAKSYGKIEAVKGVSFDVEAGEIFGFLGPNGAGKTTTINMLCTLVKPGGGAATVNGHDIVREKNEVRRSIGLVFQDTTLDDYLTAEQNIMFQRHGLRRPEGGAPRAVAGASHPHGTLGPSQGPYPHLLGRNETKAGDRPGTHTSAPRAVLG